MPKHLVLAGGGHAHLTVMKNLTAFTVNHRVTVVSPAPFHYYSGMGPGMLSGRYPPEAVRFDVRKMVTDRGGRFLEDRVLRVDPGEKSLQLHSGETLSYDLLSFNIGSRVRFPVTDPAAVVAVKPIENLLAAKDRLLALKLGGAVKTMVAGGGPAGVEIAANLRVLADREDLKLDITLLAGGGLMARHGERVRKTVRRLLAKRRVTVLENARLASCDSDRAILTDGRILESRMTFLAVGTAPPALFADAGLAGSDGGLLVNEHLQSATYPEIFGGGDCIRFAPRPLARVGVYAVRENPVLFHNLKAALTGDGAFQRFSPQSAYMLILNMGHGIGIWFRDGRVWTGRLPFLLKDYIDRSFMRKFQVSGERR